MALLDFTLRGKKFCWFLKGQRLCEVLWTMSMYQLKALGKTCLWVGLRKLKSAIKTWHDCYLHRLRLLRFNQGSIVRCIGYNLPVLLASFISPSISSSLISIPKFRSINCSSVGVTMPSWSLSSRSKAVRRSVERNIMCNKNQGH